MNEELKDTLRSVLQEELKPIHQQLERFDGVETRLGRLETDVKGLKDNLINGLGPYFERVITHIMK